MTLPTLHPRDFANDTDDAYPAANGLLFGFFLLFLLACCLSMTLFYIRRKRMARNTAVLPMHRRQGHQRSLTITTIPAYTGRDRVFVYDEKMNLIANSNGPPNSAVPEIRVTFPDEEGEQPGQNKGGRVVVVRITDSGSIGLEPFHQEQLPPYQHADTGRFQSLEIDRLGGLREREPQPPTQRWA